MRMYPSALTTTPVPPPEDRRWLKNPPAFTFDSIATTDSDNLSPIPSKLTAEDACESLGADDEFSCVGVEYDMVVVGLIFGSTNNVNNKNAAALTNSEIIIAISHAGTCIFFLTGK